MSDRNRTNPANRRHHGLDSDRDMPELADDRGVRDSRSFSGDREDDEFGSEIAGDFVADDSDDMGMDDGLGGADGDEKP